MKVYSLRTEQFFPHEVGTLFPFFSRPENLARITPPSLGFRILTPLPISMKVGTLIDYTITVAGVRTRWTTLITTYDPPRTFVDEQLKGPYSLWHHRHEFRPDRNGTTMVDEVHYALRGGVFGTLLHALFVRRQIEQIFRYRAETLPGLVAQMVTEDRS